MGARDLANLSDLKLINNDTLVTTNMRDIKQLVGDLKRWGYKMDYQDRDGSGWSKGSSTVGISINDGETKATVVVA